MRSQRQICIFIDFVEGCQGLSDIYNRHGIIYVRSQWTYEREKCIAINLTMMLQVNNFSPSFPSNKNMIVRGREKNMTLTNLT